MAINQRMLAEEMRRLQQQGMSLDRTPITMESQVNALANQPLAPGMVSAYVDESKPDPRAKSFAGEDNRIKSQRAYADMLRGKEAPKGKTVGPFDLYMGPNWGESLAYAGEQALGGYMTGLANRDDKALDEEKGRALKATLARQDEIEDRGFNLKLDEYNRGIYESDRGFDQQVDEYNRGIYESNRDHKYQRGRDNIADNQWADEYAVDLAELETQAYRDLDGVDRYITKMPDPNDNRKVINLDENGEVVDIKGWEQINPYGRGSYTSSTIKNPTTWIDDAGNIKYTYMMGDTEYDRDTNKPMEAGWITDGGFRKTKLMDEGKIADELESFGERFGPTLDMMDRVERADEAAFSDPVTGEYIGPEEGETRFSWLTKQRNTLGGASRLMNDVLSGNADEGVKFATAMDLVNAVMRARVGLSQTVTEQANIFLEAGMDIMSKPEVFEAWWRNMDDAIHRDMRMIEATTSPLILELYARNQSRIDGGDSTLDSSGRRKSVRGHGGTASKPLVDLTEDEIKEMAEKNPALLEELMK